ncbi:MAG TPA: DUF2325 domain-containing protein [Thauera aminoaromatica]|nr:DUF2325 domain-containing protein [Thauera aminoaromatica]
MNALLVGADRLGNIPDVLHNFGIRIAAHVSGRDTTHQRRSTPLPSGVGLVILFTDFLGHNVMQRFREAAGKQGVQVVCCRRSTCALQQALDRQMGSRCGECPRRCEKASGGRRRASSAC